MNYLDSKLVVDWMDATIDIIMRMYPDYPENKLKALLVKLLNENFKDKPCHIHNDYNDDMIIKASLAQIYEWVHKSKPILGGNGTFFYNHDKISSPLQKLIDDRIANRKKHQKLRDEFPQNSYEYRFHDIMQSENKIKVNSIYGSFGSSTFQLFNLYTAASTTGTAQSLISTTAIAFEGMLGDNVKFKNLAECLEFMRNICNDPALFEDTTNIPLIYDINRVAKRLAGNFFNKRDGVANMGYIVNFLKSCDTYQLTKIYYTNNLIEFMNNDFMEQLVIRLFNNAESFRNPNSVPEEILPILKTMWEYIREFVFYKHIYTEQINRLKNENRKSVILIDTDSNMIQIMPWMQKIESLFPYMETTMGKSDKTFASVNALAYLVTQMVTEALNHYCSRANVLPKFWHRINMKNEFYFPRMLLADVKKRYIALMKLKEGRELVPTKIEIKGHDFKKAGVNVTIKDRLSMIVEKYILSEDIEYLNGEYVDIPAILSEMESLENDIRNSLMSGETTFLTRVNAKGWDAYKDPFSEMNATSVLAWDLIYPEQEIQTPMKLNVIIIDLFDESKLEVIKDTFPYEYDRIKRYIFNGPYPKFRQGIKYLAIPNNITTIPEFIKPFINVDFIIQKNLNTFRPVLSALGLPPLYGSNDVEYFGNIMDI